MSQSAMHMEQYLEGIRLFNREAFFEAHEVLEDVWRIAPEGERRFMQGLIQVAVALHHHSTGNLHGTRSLLVRASRNLSVYPAHFCGIELEEFRQSLALWESALVESRPAPPLPKIRSSADCQSSGKS